MNKSGRILIVDDSRTVRLKLLKASEALGHEAVAVESGKLALEQVASTSFDVVLLNIVMPEMDGFEVLKARSSPRRAPVICRS